MKILSKRPWIISLTLVLLLSAWVVSGSLGNKDATQAEKTSVAEIIPRVRTRWVDAETVDRSVVLYGRTEPNREASLRAEIYGRVTEVLAVRGTSVKLGDPIVRIAIDDRDKQLAHAKARLTQHNLEHKGALKLSEKGYQGKTLLAEKQALLKESQALVAKLQQDIKNTTLKAPFDGVLLDRFVEIGDYLSVGDDIARIADLSPLIVKGDVSQANIAYLKAGQQAQIRFPDNSTRAGIVRFVSSLSDPKTNTFRIEVNIDNSDSSTLGGLSAEIDIPLEQVQAVRITPALLALDEAGNIGVKWVDDKTVQFTTIDIIRTDEDGAWIRGLNDRVQLITVGQAFVREGDPVIAVEEDTGSN